LETILIERKKNWSKKKGEICFTRTFFCCEQIKRGVMIFFPPSFFVTPQLQCGELGDVKEGREKNSVLSAGSNKNKKFVLFFRSFVTFHADRQEKRKRKKNKLKKRVIKF